MLDKMFDGLMMWVLLSFPLLVAALASGIWENWSKIKAQVRKVWRVR